MAESFLIGVLVLIVATLLVVLPLGSAVAQLFLRRRLRALEDSVRQQRAQIDGLLQQIAYLRTEAPVQPSSPAKAAPPLSQAVPPLAGAPVAAPESAGPPRAAARPPAATPPIAPPAAAAPPPIVPPTPAPTPAAASPSPAGPGSPLPATPARPVRPLAAPPPPPPPRGPAAPSLSGGFDWENLIGVRLFSMVAGVALVLAAVFFLRYSLEHGWLAPPVRMAIGIVVSISLLIVCELKAARRYPVTANAMDAAAIAILFATFFAGHALWNLVPSSITFGLMGLVTVVAVLLSIRRHSVFIALLGLLGGFATPALLSTGENRPVPLFAYLLLLNLGLAAVAYKEGWRAIPVLTLVLTTAYQWIWVFRFLSASQLPLAMGIFLVFAVTSFAALVLGRASTRSGRAALEPTSVAAAAMPLAFVVFLSAVPEYGAHTGLLFGFLLVVDAGLFALSTATRDERLHLVGAAATLLTIVTWLATSYVADSWRVAAAFTAVLGAFHALAPMLADRLGGGFVNHGRWAIYAAPLAMVAFPVIAAIEPQTVSPAALFVAVFALAALIAWRARATGEPILYFLAAFFVASTEVSWSARHFATVRLGTSLLLYAAFTAFYLGVPFAWRRAGSMLQPRWAGGAVLSASLVVMLYFAGDTLGTDAFWGVSIVLAILLAELFVESAWGSLPLASIAATVFAVVLLGAFWGHTAGEVGVMPSLLVVCALSLVMGGAHVWAYQLRPQAPAAAGLTDINLATYLGVLGQLLLCFIAGSPEWATPPWPLFGALAVVTLSATAVSLKTASGQLHAGGSAAAAVVVLVFAQNAPAVWSTVALAGGEVVAAYAVSALVALRGRPFARTVAIGTLATLFAAELTAIASSTADTTPALVAVTLAHVANLSLILAIAWRHRWAYVGPAAVVPAWIGAMAWQQYHPGPAHWVGSLTLATAMYAVFVAYPFILGRRAGDTRDPYVTAIAGSVFFFFTARAAFSMGNVPMVAIVPVVEGVILALMLRSLLRMEATGSRDLGRVALVAGAALAFATVAIPLQLRQQWITIGWALEGAALAWLYLRVPHRGLLYAATGLLSVVFVRLALNPAIFVYEPRGMRIFNWYLYAYLTCAAAFLAAGRWFSRTDDRVAPNVPRASALLGAGAAILLFLLLNIEIADFYATGPEITFRFGATLAQDLTYTIGWLAFGLLMLVAGIHQQSRAARSAAVALIAVTACKAFLYDMGSLGGLHRVASLVGLAVSLSVVALALQKFVLRSKEAL